MKKALSVLLSLGLVLCAMPFTAVPSLAGGTPNICGPNASFTFDESTGTLTIQGEGAIYDGTPVSYHFSGSNRLIHLVIEHGITSIGTNAFRDCTALESVSLPATLTSIGDCVFCCCTSLTEVTLPDRIMTIGYECFSRCTSLRSLHLPRNLYNVPGRMCEECESLTEIEIPEVCTGISDNAFEYCSSLTEVYLPSTLETIGVNAFSRTNLSDVYYPLTAADRDAIACSDGNGRLLAATWHYAYVPPVDEPITWAMQNGVLTISGSCDMSDYGPTASPFYNNSSITEVVVGNRVTAIGSYTFEDCSHIQTVSLPDGLTGIGEHAFYRCSALTQIQIPDSVTALGTSCFARCSALRSAQLPSGSAVVPASLFSECSALETVTIPEGYTEIHDEAFFGTALTEVRLPSTVETIGAFAFEGCSSLTDVLIPAGVTTVGDAAFAACSSLARYYCYKGSAADTYAANNGLTGAVHYFGDVNGDTDLTPMDFSAAVNASLDGTDLTDEVARTVADVNMDGVIDALDCRLVKLLSQGKDLPA